MVVQVVVRVSRGYLWDMMGYCGIWWMFHYILYLYLCILLPFSLLIHLFFKSTYVPMYLLTYLPTYLLTYVASIGEEQPAYVDQSAPAPHIPEKCLITSDPSASTCYASHSHTVRLCPCE